MEIPISKEAAKHGIMLGKKVYLDKIDFPDKFHYGGANELQADIYGFIAETVVCEYFGVDFPAFTPQQNDEFDLMIKDLKVDVKKVGYSRKTKQPKITLNKRQFARKKTKIDVFLFCTFEGAFQQLKVGINDYQIFVPIPTLGTLRLLGWVNSTEVEKISRTYVWKDREGKPMDESWQIPISKLKLVEELLKK